MIGNAHIVTVEVGTLNTRKFYQEFEYVRDQFQDVEQVRKEINTMINNMVVDVNGHHHRVIFNVETLRMMERKWGRNIVEDIRFAVLELTNYLNTTRDIERYIVDKTHFFAPYNKRRHKIVSFEDAIYSFANYLDRIEDCFDEILS